MNTKQNQVTLSEAFKFTWSVFWRNLVYQPALILVFVGAFFCLEVINSYIEIRLAIFEIIESNHSVGFLMFFLIQVCTNCVATKRTIVSCSYLTFSFYKKIEKLHVFKYSIYFGIITTITFFIWLGFERLFNFNKIKCLEACMGIMPLMGFTPHFLLDFIIKTVCNKAIMSREILGVYLPILKKNRITNSGIPRNAFRVCLTLFLYLALYISVNILIAMVLLKIAEYFDEINGLPLLDFPSENRPSGDYLTDEENELLDYSALRLFGLILIWISALFFVGKYFLKKSHRIFYG